MHGNKGGRPPFPPLTQENSVVDAETQIAEEILEIRYVTKDNAVFSKTDGGFVSMEFDGVRYPRIVLHRAFPFTDPDKYISVRDGENRLREIGVIEDLSVLSDDAQQILKEQLDIRYFTPKILKIKKIKEEYGYSYWNVKTDRGDCCFTADSGGISKISDTYIIIRDVVGNRFKIEDLNQLSTKELKMVDLYI